VTPITDHALRVLIAEISRQPLAKVTDAATFRGDLAMDSLASVDLLSSLEEEWEIEVSQQDARDMTNVGQLLTYLAAQGALRAADDA
jgi:acyl carrier protein